MERGTNLINYSKLFLSDPLLRKLTSRVSLLLSNNPTTDLSKVQVLKGGWVLLCPSKAQKQQNPPLLHCAWGPSTLNSPKLPFPFWLPWPTWPFPSPNPLGTCLISSAPCKPVARLQPPWRFPRRNGKQALSAPKSKPFALKSIQRTSKSPLPLLKGWKFCCCRRWIRVRWSHWGCWVWSCWTWTEN